MAKITREKAFESGKKYNDAQKAKSVLPLVLLGGVGALFGSLKLVGKKKYYLIPFFGFFLGLIMMIVLLVSSGSMTNQDMFVKVDVKYDAETKGVIATQVDEEPVSFKGILKDSTYSSDSGELRMFHGYGLKLVGMAPVGEENATSTAKDLAKLTAAPCLVSYISSEDLDSYYFLTPTKNYTYEELKTAFGGVKPWFWHDELNEKYGDVVAKADGTFEMEIKFSYKNTAQTMEFTIPSDRVCRDVDLDYQGVKPFNQLFVFNGEEFESKDGFNLGFNSTTKEFDIPQAHKTFTGEAYEDSTLYLHSSKYYTQRAFTFVFIGILAASFVAHLVLLIIQKNSANKYIAYVKQCSKELDKADREAFVNSMLDAARGNDLEKANAILTEKGMVEEVAENDKTEA